MSGALDIALLATFTVEPVVPFLEAALQANGLAARLTVGPYNQIAQECLDPGSVTRQGRHDLLLVWPRWEEAWGGLPYPLTDDAAPYVARGLELGRAALEGARQAGASLVFTLPALPELQPLGVGDACCAQGVVAVAEAAREQLRHLLTSEPGVLVFDAEQAVRRLGSTRAYDPRLLALAHMPFSEELLAEAAAGLARLIALSRRPARKLIVVDGDNTLWGGVVAEEGAQGVELRDNGPGAAYRAFQAYLCELRRAGALIAVASKNEEDDVWPIFARREMVLRKEELAAWRINWRPKSQNLREIADELGLGTDAIVFVDDNAAELAEVKAALPEVACVLMPADPAEWLAAIQGSALLDRLPPTRDDLQRARFYESDRLRRDTEATAPSPEAYLAALGVAIDIFPPGAGDLARLAQLVAKTNQLNLNGRRRSEAELAALCRDPRYLVRLCSASDRFGDYGIVGAFIVALEERAELDTFVLSCRAMGRGIEDAMVAWLGETLAARELLATVAELPRNEPARRFFARLGCTTIGVAAPLLPVPSPPHIARRANDATTEAQCSSFSA